MEQLNTTRTSGFVAVDAAGRAIPGFARRALDFQSATSTNPQVHGNTRAAARLTGGPTRAENSPGYEFSLSNELWWAARGGVAAGRLRDVGRSLRWPIAVYEVSGIPTRRQQLTDLSVRRRVPLAEVFGPNGSAVGPTDLR